MDQDGPIHNRSEMKQKRRDLRHKMTAAETRLWKYLKSSQLENRKFRRQHSVGPYILDFYCPTEKLSIELDGESHEGPIAAQHDAKRTAYLNAHGIRVLRFENQAVFDMPEGVLNRIREVFRDRK
ncbi:endonuclease domain-containing protein [Coraliomargarita parva]|uniref:endonuclease domain-containing protein n=1 Tax=Coraliomargarita parva TaxID=3014050 RepID=UPI0022B48A9C|nr:DUF559 domain-containing protein [Coraliomargarita parva]